MYHCICILPLYISLTDAVYTRTYCDPDSGSVNPDLYLWTRTWSMESQVLSVGVVLLLLLLLYLCILQCNSNTLEYDTNRLCSQALELTW